MRLGWSWVSLKRFIKKVHFCRYVRNVISYDDSFHNFTFNAVAHP